MNVKTKLDIFARHFVEAFRNGPKIEGLEPNARLKLQIKISEGLIINCPLTFSISIKANENPEEYKQLIRSFFKQLYEAKDSQIEALRKEYLKEKEDQGKGPEPKSVDKGFIKSVLGVEKKEAPVLKNRDLINPHKKKRKAEGLKLTGGD